MLGELLEAVQVTAGGAPASERGDGYGVKQLARSCTRLLSIKRTRIVFDHGFAHGHAQAKLIRSGVSSVPVDWGAAFDEAEAVQFTAGVGRQEARDEASTVVRESVSGRKSPRQTSDSSDSDDSEESKPRRKRGARSSKSRAQQKANKLAANKLVGAGLPSKADAAKAAAKVAAQAKADAAAAAAKGDWKSIDIVCLASKDPAKAAGSAAGVFARACYEKDSSMKRGSMPCFFAEMTKLGCTLASCDNCDWMKGLGAKAPKVPPALLAHLRTKSNASTLKILK